MKKSIIEKILSCRMYFDGGTGTVLQQNGILAAGEPPELLNERAPSVIEELHRDYIAAGADIIKTNTFGINRLKYPEYKRMLGSAIELAKRAVSSENQRDVYIALDIGPCGRMIKPLGDLDFEEAIAVFGDTARLAEGLGCDLILIETMSDMYETKAAVLGAKENSTLPVFVTLAFGSDGKLMSGADPAAMIAMLEGLRVDAIGVNCSLGPREMMNTVSEFLRLSSLPIIVNPNAGLPRVVNNRFVYDISPSEFAEEMREFAEMGVSILGGCCGTTPEYVRKLIEGTKNVPLCTTPAKDMTVISSYTHAVTLRERPLIIGERINPTGKPKLKAALREKNMSFILSEAIAEAEEGADVLDVNTGLADIDETEAMCRAIYEIQSVCDLPLQIDTGKEETLARAMRIYCGKPLVNSVNGSEASMSYVFPLVQKYGGVIIALTMDDSGIPDNVEGRVAIAERIARRAAEYGITPKDIVFDPLAMTVASGDENALVTLGSIRELKKRGYKTSLGVSNVSFGLPERDTVNSSFFTAALWAGLDMAIINPHSPLMMNAYYSYLALSGKDSGCAKYIENVRGVSLAPGGVPRETREISTNYSLESAIIKGLADAARDETMRLMGVEKPLDIINGRIIPALDRVGADFESRKIYLPSLLKSAEAASLAFDVIKHSASKREEATVKKNTVVIATVKGDIHDIGKNIVKLMLESYGYPVIDLGKDVCAEVVLRGVLDSGARILGLSALMTTTLPAMEHTVRLVREKAPQVKIIVGGAVLTETYAKKIGADFYAKDAMAAVRFAEKLGAEDKS